MNKLRGKSLMELVSLGSAVMPYLRTNLRSTRSPAWPTPSLNSELENVESLRLPINDSYVQETRNEQSMLYDCDWQANTNALYAFIYE